MSAITHGGGVLAPKSVPQQFFYTGTMEVRTGVTADRLDLTDIQPGAVRFRAESANTIANTIQRSVQFTAAGCQLIPCLETDGWASKAAFNTYLQQWIDGVDPAVLWWEIGNEPSTGGDPSTIAGRAAIRDKYLDYMTDASAILDANGKKLILSAITGTAGGTQNVLDDINTAVQGAAFSMVDGMAVHPYCYWATDQGDGKLNVRDSLFGYRGLFDGAPYSLGGKPMFVTEIGWSCATRADGIQHGDWGVGVPSMIDGTAGGQKPRTITLVQQANLLTDVMTMMAANRFKNQLYLLAGIWFAHHDYSIPDPQWDRHCGLIDAGQGKRPSYNALKGLQRAFAV